MSLCLLYYYYYQTGLGKQSRSLFLELDATASKSPIQESPSSANLRPTTRLTPRQNSQVHTNNHIKFDTVKSPIVCRKLYLR